MSNQVAQTILSQLGGNRFIAMTGSKHFLSSENSLSFKFPGCKQYNHCKIILEANDYYRVEFLKFKGLNISNENAYSLVSNDMLQLIFKTATGLETSF